MKRFTSALIFAIFVGFIAGFFIMHLSVTSYAATCTAYKNGNGCHERIGKITYAYLKDTSKTGNLSKNDVIRPYSDLTGNKPVSTPIVQSEYTGYDHCKNSDVDCNQDKKEQHKKHAPINKPVSTPIVQNTVNVTNVQNTYNTVEQSTYDYDENEDSYSGFCTLPTDDDSVVVFCNGDVLVFYHHRWHQYRYNG